MPSSAHAQKSTIGRTYFTGNAFSALSGVAPSLAAALAERLFTTSLRSRVPERERSWAIGARRDAVRSPHGDLPVWIWGDGPKTVLLAHGWGGRGLQMAAFAPPLVAAGYRVVAYDAPAHGSAPGRTSNVFRHTEGLAAAANAYRPLTGVVGHSLGCSATLLAAARLGVAPRSVVLVAPAARTTALTDWFGRMSGFSPYVVELMRRRLERRLAFRWDDVEPFRLAAVLEAEALIIHDRHDREIPWNEGVRLAVSSRSARLLTTQNLGHRRILRDAAVVEAASNFIAGVDRLTRTTRARRPTAIAHYAA